MAKRAVIRVSMQLMHDLLQLPEGVEVLHVAPADCGLWMAVVVTHPDLPDVPDDVEAPHLDPVYRRHEGGRVEFESLGNLTPAGGWGL